MCILHFAVSPWHHLRDAGPVSPHGCSDLLGAPAEGSVPGSQVRAKLTPSLMEMPALSLSLRQGCLSPEEEDGGFVDDSKLPGLVWSC